jgi:dTDP-glucose 4,6-dehydratase
MKKKLKYHFVPPETARVGYDRRYAIDGSKLRDMGWNPPMTFEESLKKVVDWGRFNYHWL